MTVRLIPVLFVSLLGGSLIALACGGTSDVSAPSADGGAVAETSVDGAVDGTPACTQYATARCQKLDSCTAGLASRERFGDLATCIARGVLGCSAALAAPDTSATPEFFTACAAALTSSSCADFIDDTNIPQACLNLAGPRASGAACSFSAQCQSSWCQVLRGAACGVCAVRPAAGAACTTDSDCGARGLFCSKAGSCVSHAILGAPCDDARPCGVALSCVGQTKTVPGACAAAIQTVGAACDPKRATAAGCDGALSLYCGLDDKCASDALVAAPGACGRLVDSDGGSDDAGASDAGASDAGVRELSVARCTGGAVCAQGSATSGTCVAPAADGAGCDSASGPPCLAPARCVTTSDASTGGTCQLPGANACK